MVASGTGAPPHSSMRRLDRSASGHRGCAADRVVHRGHAEQRGHPVAFDHLQGAARLESGLDEHRAALEQGRQAEHVQRRGVEQRCHDQRDLVLPEVGVHHHVERVPGDVAVAERGALGTSRGPRRVHDQARVAQADLFVEVRARSGGEQGGVTEFPAGRLPQRDHVGCEGDSEGGRGAGGGAGRRPAAQPPCPPDRRRRSAPGCRSARWRAGLGCRGPVCSAARVRASPRGGQSAPGVPVVRPEVGDPGHRGRCRARAGRAPASSPSSASA